MIALCPFCALLCDDLPAAALRPDGHEAVDCPRLTAARSTLAGPVPPPRIEGRPASLEDALERAALRLRQSRLPLVLLAGADVVTARVAVALAEGLRGVLDLDRGGRPPVDALVRARRPMVLATLAEVRRRADLVLLVGTDGTTALPRLFARVLNPPPMAGAEGPRTRRIVRLGAGFTSRTGVEDIACAQDELHQALAVLRAHVAGRRLPPSPLAARADLARLADDLRRARYAVVVWHAAELPAARAELIVDMLAGLVQELHAHTRALGLPLAVLPTSADKVTLWQSGMAPPVSWRDGAPDGEPRLWDGGRLLASGRVDRLLWLGLLPDARPPTTTVPTIALHHPGIAPEAEIVVPVAVPGIHADATFHRLDGVVVLRARRVAEESTLPTAATVLESLRRRLGRGGAA